MKCSVVSKPTGHTCIIHSFRTFISVKKSYYWYSLIPLIPGGNRDPAGNSRTQQRLNLLWQSLCNFYIQSADWLLSKTSQRIGQNWRVVKYLVAESIVCGSLGVCRQWMWSSHSWRMILCLWLPLSLAICCSILSLIYMDNKTCIRITNTTGLIWCVCTNKVVQIAKKFLEVALCWG